MTKLVDCMEIWLVFGLKRRRKSCPKFRKIEINKKKNGGWPINFRIDYTHWNFWKISLLTVDVCDTKISKENFSSSQ